MILWSNIRSLRVGLLPAAAPAPAVCILLVQACLTGWSCLPALMNPQPLIGIATNQTLNCSGKARRVDFQVLMLVSSARQLNWRIAEKEITVLFLVPNRDRGNHHCVGFQGERRDAGSRARQPAKERNEYSFMRLGVQVR